MPQKKQKGYQGAMDSLFGFVFSQSNKKPGKLRPVRPTGYKAPSDEIANGIGELMGKPWLYAADNVMNPITDALFGQEWFNFVASNVNTAKGPRLGGGAAEVSIKTKGIAKLIKNPGSLVDSAYEAMKAERSWSNIWGYQLGRGIDAAAAMAVAWRAGKVLGKSPFSAEEIWNLGSAARDTTGISMKQGMQKMAIKASVYDELAAEAKKSGGKVDYAKVDEMAEKVFQASVATKELRKGRTTAGLAGGMGGPVHNVEREILRLTAEASKTIADPVKAREAAVAAYMKGNGIDGREFANLRIRENDFRNELTKLGFNSQQQTDMIDRIGLKHRNYGFNYLDDKDPHRYRDALGDYHHSRQELLKQGVLDAVASGKSQSEINQLLEERQKSVVGENMAVMFQRLKSPTDSQSEFSFGPSVAFIDGLISANKSNAALVTSLNNIKSKINQAEQNHIRGISKDPATWNIAGALRTSRLYSNQYLAQGAEKTSLVNRNIGPISQGWQQDDKFARQAVMLEIEAKRAVLFSDRAAIDAMPDSPEKTARLKIFFDESSALDRSQNAIKRLPLTNFRNNIGNGVVAWRSFKSVFLEGGLAGEILSGTFWLKDEFWGPSSLKKINIASEEGGAYVTKIAVPKVNLPHYKILTDLYYMRPDVMISTLTNGTHFYYFAYMNQQKARLGLAALLIKEPSLKTDLETFLGIGPDGDFETGLDKKFLPAFDELMKKYPSGPIHDHLVKLQKYTDKIKRYGKVGKFFQSKLGIAERLSAPVKKFTELVKNKVTGPLLLRLSSNPDWKKKVKGFLDGAPDGLGLNDLLISGLKDWLSALKVIPVGWVGILVSIASYFLPDLMDKITKPISKAFVYSIWIFLFLVCAFVSFLVSSATGRSIPQMYYNPAQAIGGAAGEEYDPDAPIGSGTVPGTGGPLLSVPDLSYAQCPINNSFACTQGPKGSFSHTLDYYTKRGVLPIDIVPSGDDYFYAPDDGTVSHISSNGMCGTSGYSYGGSLWFTDSKGHTYNLLHVVPEANLQNGSEVKKGDKICRVQRNIAADCDSSGNNCKNPCWTGAHIHMEIFDDTRAAPATSNNVYNTEIWMRSLCGSFKDPC